VEDSGRTGRRGDAMRRGGSGPGASLVWPPGGFVTRGRGRGGVTVEEEEGGVGSVGAAVRCVQVHGRSRHGRLDLIWAVGSVRVVGPIRPLSRNAEFVGLWTAKQARFS
jgi:hypothetical protein